MSGGPRRAESLEERGVVREIQTMTEEDKENGAAATEEVSKMDATPTDAATGAAVAGTPADTADAPAAEPTADASDASESAEDDESSDDEAVGSDGLTRYERERQANIQRNKELMMQLSINKMADKLKPEETDAPKKRGPKGGWKKKRAAMKPSRGSSRIQRLQEERKHTAWKDLHVEKSLKTHPNCFVDLTVQCLGMADASQTFGESRGGDEEDQLLPLGFFAEGEFMNETLYVWVDFEGKHHVMWGESEGARQRHVETEEGGCDTAAGAALCIMRESQRRRLELLGSIPSKGVSKPLGLRVHHSNLPLLDKNAPAPARPGGIMHFDVHRVKPSTYVKKYNPTGRPRGRPRKYPLPGTEALTSSSHGSLFTKPKPKPKPKVEPLPPPRAECAECGRKREDTTRMRPGPGGPGTLCNACGMYWVTQGRARPAGLFEDDYERVVPPGATPLVSLGKQSWAGMLRRPASSAKAEALGAKIAEPASSPAASEEKKTDFDTEIDRLIEEADEEMRDGESEDEDEPVATALDGEVEGNTATEAKPPGEVDSEANATKRESAAPAAPAVPAKPEGARTFFRDAVKCASAGLITPAMVGADDFPQSVSEGGTAPRWCPHLWAGLPPLLGITEDAAYEVKRSPQDSALAKAFAAVADSDPVKDAGADKLDGYPNQAWYAARSAALALAGYGGTAAGMLIGKPAIFPTKFALPQMTRPRVYTESDLDAVTLFGYAETEVQQGLMAQLEKYEQMEEREGAVAAEKQRETDYAEAVANLEAAIFSARNDMRKADARADREARFERAEPRIETVAAAVILCPPLPKVERPSAKGRGGGAAAGGGGDDIEAAGYLTESACVAIDGAEDIPTPLAVTCGEAPPGLWQPGGRPKEERIFVETTGETYSPAGYERLAGMGQAKKWRKSVRVPGADGAHLGDYLAALGARKGETVVGCRVGIWWPLDESFYLGTVEGFIPTTGEHTVRYDDGESEDLLLPMQRVKWLPAGTGRAGAGALLSADAADAAKAADEVDARRKAAEEARRAEERRIEEEHRGILSPEGRYRVNMGAFDVWATRPAQWKMRHSERRKCFEVLEALRCEPDPDDDPDDEDEPPRLLIEPFEKLPGPRELPDYYELIRCPVDCRSIERALRRAPERSYASPWFFACAVELMLTNAQTYNDEDSQIFQEAGFLRRAFHKAMSTRFPGQPLPQSVAVYESCDEPDWVRPPGWAAPVSDADVADERDPFEADRLDVETQRRDEDEERALARAVAEGGAMYGSSEHVANIARRFARPGPGRPPKGPPKPPYVPTGRPVGRPRKYPRPEDEAPPPRTVTVEDAPFDPRKPDAPAFARVAVTATHAKRRRFSGAQLGPAAAAARDALYAAEGASMSLDALVAAVEAAKVPEVVGARRVNAAVLGILRQHTDVFAEALTGDGARFTLNPAAFADEEEEETPAPSRAPSGRAAKRQKSYADSDEEMEEEEEEEEEEEQEEGTGAMTPSKVEKCREILQKARDLKVKGRLLSELFELLPTRKQMPDYYREIANPVDFKSISASLKKAGGYASVWDFLISVELMFSNAQVYNEKDSQIFGDAEAMRKAIRAALEKTFPGHPYPKPMSVYEQDQCAEPAWRPKKKLTVVMSSKKSGKDGPLKVKMQGAARCGKCINCLERSRKQRCLDAQMRDNAREGHEGAQIAVEGKDASGVRIEIYWPPEDIFYKGKIVGFDPRMCAHEIQYDNGDVETMELWRKGEQVKRVEK